MEQVLCTIPLTLFLSLYFGVWRTKMYTDLVFQTVQLHARAELFVERLVFFRSSEHAADSSGSRQNKETYKEDQIAS
jgi:hypothetical protein